MASPQAAPSASKRAPCARASAPIEPFNPPNNSCSSFGDLPPCMQQRIFSLLPTDAADILRASGVCRAWAAAADDALAAAPRVGFAVAIWGRRSLLSWLSSLSTVLNKCARLRDLEVSLACALPEPLEPVGIEVLLEGFLRQLATLSVVKTRLEGFALSLSGDLAQPTRGLDFVLAAAALKRLALTNVVIPAHGLNLRRTDRCAASLGALALTGVEIAADDLCALVAYLRGLEVLELCGTGAADLHVASEGLRVLRVSNHAVGVLDLKTPKLEDLRVEKGRANMGFTLCTEGKSKIRRLSITLQGLGYLRIFGELREVEAVTLSANCWDWTGNIASVLQNSPRLLHLALEAARDTPPDYPDIGNMLARMTTAAEPLDLFSFPGRFPRLVSLTLPLGMTEQMVLGARVSGDQSPQFAALESLEVAIWQPSAAHLRWLEGLVEAAPRLKRVAIAIVAKWDKALLHFSLRQCSAKACIEYLDDTGENLYTFFHGLCALQKRSPGVDIAWEKIE
ncbi:hypothetical protein KFL_000370180 [Klebsormidium nitens]|uniref:F-box domain-containing protein n=1 Tax=Klebsormidium nitens TaxID=105231 RepID=A0A1Y1HMB3_KLENI|nr:hypothetical protein KFL_000370180 [Klebsormidium nitens]|eukprot:GAQ79744.1 hypothetical protein KFL_000370180 [Klebsormidium nitens]